MRLTRLEIAIRYFQPFQGCFPTRTIKFGNVCPTAPLHSLCSSWHRSFTIPCTLIKGNNRACSCWTASRRVFPLML